MDKPLTAAQAAEQLRVHRTTVLAWRSRGWRDPEDPKTIHKLRTVDRDPDTGARRFDWGELVTAEQQTRAKRQRSHRHSRKLVAA